MPSFVIPSAVKGKVLFVSQFVKRHAVPTNESCLGRERFGLFPSFFGSCSRSDSVFQMLFHLRVLPTGRISLRGYVIAFFVFVT